MIARLEVTRGPLTEYPLAEKVCGGWQNGVMFYPDAEVTKVTPLIFRNETPTDDEQEALVKRLEDEVEYRVRTAVALHKGGHDHGDQVRKGRASVRFIAAGFRRSEVPEPSAEDEFAPGECDGSGKCSAPRHIHGCYTAHRADQCDAPDEYGHLPADDEREALEQIVIHVSANTPGDLISTFRRDQIVRGVLAAGFHRTEQGESQ